MQAVVLKTTLKGEPVWKIQGPPDIPEYKAGADGKPARYNPTNVAIAPNGDVYVGRRLRLFLHQPIQREG